MNLQVFLNLACILFLAVACESPTSVKESIATVPISNQAPVTSLFVGGTKAVKINTHDLLGGSFVSPAMLPGIVAVPANFPGSASNAVYLPGISATSFFDVDGITSIPKPSWLLDLQLGITALPGSSTCATFGGAGIEDANGYFRTSEIDCVASTNSGTGSNLNDRAFIRVILDRGATSFGTAENLMMQIEYQASGIRLNSDGVNLLPENNLDQLWKIFWNTTLAGSQAPNVFSVFVPPNYGACLNSGSGATSAPGNCLNGYTGAPITTKQIIIPLSAYPKLSVLQISRMKGRINNTDVFPGTAPSPGPVNYVVPFFASSPSSNCQADSPLCLGVVIRSILLMRI